MTILNSNFQKHL